MDGDRAFCIHCGAILHDGAEYCPECGYAIYGGMSVSSARIDSPPVEPQVVPSDAEKSLLVVLLMTRLYGFFAVFMGICAVVMPESVVESFREYLNSAGIDWESFLAELGVTQEGLVTCIALSGAVTFASGSLVLASSYLVRAHRRFALSMALCAAGSLVLLATALVVPQPIVVDGLMVSGLMCSAGFSAVLLMYLSKDAFVD